MCPCAELSHAFILKLRLIHTRFLCAKDVHLDALTLPLGTTCTLVTGVHVSYTCIYVTDVHVTHAVKLHFPPKQRSCLSFQVCVRLCLCAHNLWKMENVPIVLSVVCVFVCVSVDGSFFI